jgi:HKD family nuclease
VFIAVSFFRISGLRHLFKTLKPALEKGAPVSVYTSGYLQITEPAVLERLLVLQKHYGSLSVSFNPDDRFHAKCLLFEKLNGKYAHFLGSSNVSVEGLSNGGELNVQIEGKSSDGVYKDLQVVIHHLESDPGFVKLNKELILQYQMRYAKQIIRVKRAKVFSVPKRPSLPSVETMPVFVMTRQFTDKEEERIAEIHPKWDDYFSLESKFKNLARGDHYLKLSSLPGKEKCFSVTKYLEFDRVRGVGANAHVQGAKEEYPLEKLADKLAIKQRALLRKTKLDIYDIAILKKQFPEAFA